MIDPLTVTCPLCGNPPGDRCTTSQGRRPHDARLGEAIKASILATPPEARS